MLNCFRLCLSVGSKCALQSIRCIQKGSSGIVVMLEAQNSTDYKCVDLKFYIASLNQIGSATAFSDVVISLLDIVPSLMLTEAQTIIPSDTVGIIHSSRFRQCCELAVTNGLRTLVGVKNVFFNKHAFHTFDSDVVVFITPSAELFC